MKIEIPDCFIKTWHENLELNGYDAPADEKEWIELIKLCVDKEVGEDQFDWNIMRKQRQLPITKHLPRIGATAL